MLNQLFTDPCYVKRAEEWLLEHIDLDPDGQYTEKSSGGYSAVVNKALIQFGPGKLEHKAVHLRGGLPAVIGAPSVYLTEFTPFKHKMTLK